MANYIIEFLISNERELLENDYKDLERTDNEHLKMRIMEDIELRKNNIMNYEREYIAQ